MSSPRHLWSGDWQLDSAAVAEELARRRAQSEEPAGPGPGPEPPPPRSRPSAIERILAWLREARRTLASLIAHARAAIRTARGRLGGRGRRLAVVLALLVVALLSAGVAFGVTSLLVGSGHGSQTASADHVWLGVGLTNSPYSGGVMITTVAPGSPAAAAGLQSGDLITQINNQPIQAAGDVNAALAGLRAGNQIQIQFDRGQVSYSTLVTLAARPAHTP